MGMKKPCPRVSISFLRVGWWGRCLHDRARARERETGNMPCEALVSCRVHAASCTPRPRHATPTEVRKRKKTNRSKGRRAIH